MSGPAAPQCPSHLTYPSYGSYSLVFIFAHFLFLHISIFAHFSGGVRGGVKTYGTIFLRRVNCQFLEKRYLQIKNDVSKHNSEGQEELNKLVDEINRAQCEFRYNNNLRPEMVKGGY